MDTISRHSTWKLHLLIAGLYAILAVLLTWPMAAKLTSNAFPNILPWYGGDPNIFIWWFDLLAKSVSGQLPEAAGRMIFWPGGIDLLAGYDGPLMLAIGVPLTLVSGNPFFAYKVFLLVCLVSASWFSYRLVFRISGSPLASFISGIIFGLSPYMLIRALVHPNLMMTFVIPLTAWAAWEFLEAPTRRRAWLLAGTVLLSTLSSFYYLIFSLLFLLLAFLWRLPLLWRHRLTTLLALLLMATAAALPALPMIYAKGSGAQPATEEFIDFFGTRPLNFVVPHPYTNILGIHVKDIYAGFEQRYFAPGGEWESTSYFGPLLLILVTLFAVGWRRWREHRPWFWLTSFLLFTVLSLGNYVDLAGHRLTMPFRWLNLIFPFTMIRAPNRFFIFALLAAAVMAGLVLARMFQRLRQRFPGRAGLRWIILVTVPVLLLLGAERVIYPYPVTELSVPEFYRQIGAERERFAVADLPIWNPGYSLYNYYQVFHGHPMTSGEYFYPAYTPTTLGYVRSNPLLAASFCEPGAAAVEGLDRSAVFDDLRRNGIRYLVIHNLLLHNDGDCHVLKANLNRFFEGMEPAFIDGEITAYRVPDGL